MLASRGLSGMHDKDGVVDGNGQLHLAAGVKRAGRQHREALREVSPAMYVKYKYLRHLLESLILQHLVEL